jgi:DNA polymerase-1
MKHLVIIDGFSFLFRAYHAVRDLTRSDGLHTNALFGFANMLVKVTKDLNPDFYTVALDSEGKTFRHNMYDEYKANRKPMDDEMAQQMPFFQPLINSFGIHSIAMKGLEADDIIASLVEKYKNEYKITIVSSDKDLMQLLGGNTTMLDTMKNRIMGVEAVQEKFGVTPDKVIEVQSLIGDTSDNIPGVPSIGPKTASQLIEQFGSLEGIYANLDEVKRDKLRDKLIEHKENAFISHELVTLKTDINIPCPIDDLAFHPDLSCARDFLLELEFNRLADRISPKSEGQEVLKQEEKVKKVNNYECITTKNDLNRWVSKLEQARIFAIDTETTSIDAIQAELVGISLAVGKRACYIPVKYTPPSSGALDFGEAEETVKILDKKVVLDALKPILKDKKYTKIGQNIKYDMIIFESEGITLKGIEDTMVMSFCLDAGLNRHGMDALAKLHLNHTCIAFKEVCGTGKKQITFDMVDLDKATDYAAEDADITLQLYTVFKERLENTPTVKKLYTEIELPLIPTLVNMERNGVLINRSELEHLSLEFFNRLQSHEKAIYALSGETFNINSPKQLGEVLFDKMGLSIGGKKKKSTNVDVMEKLKEQGEEIATEVLKYRHLAKLRSTYTEALTQQINPETKRIHTSYNQVGAATGRFSSSDPNLQNIPIRTEDGRKIRHAFIPQDGWVFVGADYSQVELRLLAHVAGIKSLQQAFLDDKDIHAFTAHQIFNVPLEDVTKEQRSASKAINFGIVYGMGYTALAKQIGVSRTVAKEYIESYFERYDGLRAYMDNTIALAQENGYVETMFGRRIHTPNINEKNPMMRTGAERAAINAPLQGANADIIKMVMPKIQQKLHNANLKTRMLMQVHDELVFEVPKEELDQAKELIQHTMETAAELSVPLKVGVEIGDNWEDAH